MTDAVVAARGGDVVAVVCPAFPAVGRTLVDGILLVHGVPVAQTAVGRDPVTPVRESHVPTLLDAPLVVLDPRADDAELAAALRGRGPVVVVDARDEADLDRVARAVLALGNQAVAVGSAGLAAHLARRWRPLPRGPVLVVVSSLHDASRGQAELLAAAGARRIQPDAATLCDSRRLGGVRPLDRFRRGGGRLRSTGADGADRRRRDRRPISGGRPAGRARVPASEHRPSCRARPGRMATVPLRCSPPCTQVASG